MSNEKHSADVIIQTGINLKRDGKRVTAYAISQVLTGGNYRRIKKIWDDYESRSDGGELDLQHDQCAAQAVDAILKESKVQIVEILNKVQRYSSRVAEEMVNKISSIKVSNGLVENQDLLSAMDRIETLESQVEQLISENTGLKERIHEIAQLASRNIVDEIMNRIKIDLLEDECDRLNMLKYSGVTEISRIQNYRGSCSPRES